MAEIILEALSELRQELRAMRLANNELVGEVRALRSALTLQTHAQKTARRVRLEKRHSMMRNLADATGFGKTYEAATEVMLILVGRREIPDGFEETVTKLRNDVETPMSQRGIWRVISGGQ